jgi:hypothetical protein
MGRVGGFQNFLINILLDEELYIFILQRIFFYKRKEVCLLRKINGLMMIYPVPSN